MQLVFLQVYRDDRNIYLIFFCQIYMLMVMIFSRRAEKNWSSSNCSIFMQRQIMAFVASGIIDDYGYDLVYRIIWAMLEEVVMM